MSTALMVLFLFTVFAAWLLLAGFAAASDFGVLACTRPAAKHNDRVIRQALPMLLFMRHSSFAGLSGKNTL